MHGDFFVPFTFVTFSVKNVPDILKWMSPSRGEFFMTSGKKDQDDSLLQRIVRDLAATQIHEKFPEAPERKPDHKVVGQCDDYLKRLFSYCYELAKKLKPLHGEIEDLGVEFMEPLDLLMDIAAGKEDASDLFTEKFGGLRIISLQVMALRLGKLRKDLKPKQDYLNLIAAHIVPELHRRIPDAGKCSRVAVTSDWSVIAVEDEQLKDILQKGPASVFAIFTRKH